MTHTPLQEELMPCPFCGGEAERLTLTEDDNPGNAGGDVIVCTRCQCSSHVEFDFKENLVSRWNTRRHPLATVKAIAAAVVQAACETDPADTDHPDTILITTDDLETIVRNAVENHNG